MVLLYIFEAVFWIFCNFYMQKLNDWEILES